MKRVMWTVLAVVLLVAVMLGDVYLLKPAIEQLSWKIASRRFDCWDMAATSEENIILVGNDILHFNGLYWRKTSLPLWLITCERLGKPNACEKEQGIDWPTYHNSSAYLKTVCAYDQTHIYAGGAAGILRYNGLFWRQMPVAEGLEPEPDDLWVQNSDSIYALDDDLGVLYWDGEVWDVLSLPVEEGFRPRHIGGTVDHVVIIGRGTREGEEGQVLLIQEGDTWTCVDSQAMFEGVETLPKEGSHGQLEFADVWSQDDGRIIVSVAESLWFTPYHFELCRRLISYEQGTWSFIEAPPLSLFIDYQSQLTQVVTDPQGQLLALSNMGELVHQVEDPSASGQMRWESVESDALYILGAQEFLSNTQLLVYGCPVTAITMEGSPIAEGSYTVHSFQLDW